MLIVGLGNPGSRYENTRHNMGFLTIDRLAEKTGFNFRKPFLSKYLIAKGVYRGIDLYLVKPLTFMNLSGSVLPGIMEKYSLEIDDLILVCDNLDLYPGVVRFKGKGGDAGHNGIKSVIEYTGTGNFKRFYIGIGRPDFAEKTVEYVLGKPDIQEFVRLGDAVETVSEGILKLLEMPAEKVMNEINRIKNRTDNTSD